MFNCSYRRIPATLPYIYILLEHCIASLQNVDLVSELHPIWNRPLRYTPIYILYLLKFRFYMLVLLSIKCHKQFGELLCRVQNLGWKYTILHSQLCQSLNTSYKTWLQNTLTYFCRLMHPNKEVTNHKLDHIDF